MVWKIFEVREEFFGSRAFVFKGIPRSFGVLRCTLVLYNFIQQINSRCIIVLKNKIYLMQTIHLIIKGKVQGVFYRASAKEAADVLQIKGWVKNTAAGDVEILASGDANSIEKFIEWCRKGPRRAIVTDVIINTQTYTAFNDFKVER